MVGVSEDIFHGAARAFLLARLVRGQVGLIWLEKFFEDERPGTARLAAGTHSHFLAMPRFLQLLLGDGLAINRLARFLLTQAQAENLLSHRDDFSWLSHREGRHAAQSGVHPLRPLAKFSNASSRFIRSAAQLVPLFEHALGGKGTMFGDDLPLQKQAMKAADGVLLNSKMSQGPSADFQCCCQGWECDPFI